VNKEARTVFNTIQQTFTSRHQLESFNALLAAFLDADGKPRPEHTPIKSPSAFKRDCVITRGKPDLKFEMISPIPDAPHALEAASLFNTRRFTKPATTPKSCPCDDTGLRKNSRLTLNVFTRHKLFSTAILTFET
jgi:hypothetical protein